MKQLATRSLALLLALVLCIGMVPGVAFTASAAAVNYVTGNPKPVDNSDTRYTDVVSNWGAREVTATSLSPMAEEYYDGGQFYEEITAVYNNGGNLYSSLQNYMKSHHKNITNYSSTRALYAYTDCQNSQVGNMSSFYSGMAIGPNWDSGKTWNREHTWPNSKGLETKL